MDKDIALVLTRVLLLFPPRSGDPFLIAKLLRNSTRLTNIGLGRQDLAHI
jgi:hypothetical protein